MSVKWHGDRLKKEVEAKCFKNMGTACLFLEGQIKQSVSGPSPSAPHEPPGVVTGTLRRSITYEIEVGPSGVTGKVGTNVVYSLPLEFGSSRMSARPFLRPGLEKGKKQIAKILAGK